MVGVSSFFCGNLCSLTVRDDFLARRHEIVKGLFLSFLSFLLFPSISLYFLLFPSISLNFLLFPSISFYFLLFPFCPIDPIAYPFFLLFFTRLFWQFPFLLGVKMRQQGEKIEKERKNGEELLGLKVRFGQISFAIFCMDVEKLIQMMVYSGCLTNNFFITFIQQMYVKHTRIGFAVLHGAEQC